MAFDANRGLLEYIRKSPSALFAVQNAVSALSEFDFSCLSERKPWTLQPGKSYYLTRGDSCIAAFRLPSQFPAAENAQFHIWAAHGDSPAFRVKPLPELARQSDAGYLRLNTEPYGGGNWVSWFDRPLSVAGRVALRTDHGVRIQAVNIDRDIAMLPNLPIHFNTRVNEGVAINNQTDLCPLLTCGDGNLLDLLSTELNCEKADILSHELTVYCRSDGRIWGAENEFLSAPRLDDLACAYAGLQGLLQADLPAPDCIPIWFCFDHEEIGSETLCGAAGTFFDDFLTRLCSELHFNHEQRLQIQSRSLLISADNAHALHPAHGEVFDPNNRVYMNKGIVIKHAVAYSTNGVSDCILRCLCENLKLPVQLFANVSTQRGGSTLANLASTQVGIRMVDIGIAQLAMHAAYETMGSRDLTYFISLAKGFFNHRLTENPENTFCWDFL